MQQMQKQPKPDKIKNKSEKQNMELTQQNSLINITKKHFQEALSENQDKTDFYLQIYFRSYLRT